MFQYESEKEPDAKTISNCLDAGSFLILQLKLIMKNMIFIITFNIILKFNYKQISTIRPFGAYFIISVNSFYKIVG